MEENNSKANSRIARNTIFLSIRMFIVLCINLYATRIVLENLGVENYGIYNVVCGFVSMFMFINTSLSNGIQRFYNYEIGSSGPDGLGKVYSTAILIQGIVIALMLLLTETIGLWYLNNKMVIPPDKVFSAKCIYQLAIASFVIVIMQSPFTAAVLAFEKMDYYAIVSVIVTVLKLGSAFAISYFTDNKLIVYGILLLLISVLEYFLYYIYVKFKFKTVRFVFHKDFSLFKSMLSFSGWNILGSFSGVMKEQGINLILNLFFGPIVNAARAVAAQVSGGLQSFVNNFTVPVRPQVIQSYAAGDIRRTMSLTFTISKLSCYFLYLLALPIIIEIDFILHIWLGNDVPDYASSFIVIIIITSFFNNLNAAVSGVVHASGKMMRYQLFTSIISLMSLPLAYYALKCGAGPDSALIVVCLVMIVVQLVSLLILKDIVSFSLSDYFREVILPVIMVVLISIMPIYAISLLMDQGWLRLVITIVASFLLVSCMIYLLGLSKSEKFFVNGIFQKVLHKRK